MAAKVRGFRTTQCPGSMAQKQMGLTVYVQINRKGVRCGRQWQLLDNIQLP